MKREIKIGDVIERKIVVWSEDRAFDSWKRGTVIDVMHHQIALEYDDGTREFVERGIGQMRIP